MVMAHPAAPPC